MENHKLVLPGDLNQNGYLFGGNLLKWVDEYAWIAASLEFPGCSFVTIAMDNVVFKKSVKEGSILKFDIRLKETGHTSVKYNVNVLCQKACDEKMDTIFSTIITFVNINSNGEKNAIQTLH
ncbi:MAG: acyl-CoA thioesterase [Mariniphaga sp.]|nr:acyl-CoA thioesterase [Mariniphaga sp.]